MSDIAERASQSDLYDMSLEQGKLENLKDSIEIYQELYDNQLKINLSGANTLKSIGRILRAKQAELKKLQGEEAETERAPFDN